MRQESHHARCRPGLQNLSDPGTGCANHARHQQASVELERYRRAGCLDPETRNPNTRRRRLRDPHAAISTVVGRSEPRRPKASVFQGLSKKVNRWAALIPKSNTWRRRLRDPHAAISAVVGRSEPRRAKTSVFQGLSKKFNRWKALIKINGKRKELASFSSEPEAARCYDRHATLAWGARRADLRGLSPKP